MVYLASLNGAELSLSCTQDQRASRVDLDGDFSQVFQELATVAGPPPF